MESQPNYHKEITIYHVVCPLHILQLKKGLSQIETNQTLKVFPGQPAVVNELLSACKTLEHKAEIKTINNQPILFIEKDIGPVFTLIPPAGLILLEDLIVFSDLIGITPSPYSNT